MRPASILILLLAAGFAPFASASIDPPPAVLCDSGARLERNDVALFFADQLNGKRIADTAWSHSGKDPDAAGFRIRIVTRARELRGPATVRINANGMSAPIWVSDGLRVKGEVRFDPVPGGIYRVAGVLGPDYSAVWIEDAEGNRATGIVESFGKDQDKADAARTQALTTSVSKVASNRAQAFLQMDEGECETIIKARFGEPDARQTVGRIMGNRFEILEYHGIGDAWMKHGSLQRVRAVLSEEAGQSPAAVRDSLVRTEHDSLRITARGYAHAGITDPAILDVMAEFIWNNRDTNDRAIADAAAHLCHALGKSRNPRYRNLLEQIASQSPSRALRRHAKQNLEFLHGSTDAPWTPPD